MHLTEILDLPESLGIYGCSLHHRFVREDKLWVIVSTCKALKVLTLFVRLRKDPVRYEALGVLHESLERWMPVEDRSMG